MLPTTLIQAEPASGTVRARVLLPPPPGGKDEDVFGGALLDDVVHKRKPVDWLISLATHVAIVAAVLIVPIFFTQAIDLTRFETTYLATPPTPLAAPPPPPAAAAAPQAPRKPDARLQTAKLVMPIAIPKAIQISHSAADTPPEDAPDPNSLIAGVPGGVVGGVPGGVLGGILGGSGVAAPPPPPPTTANPNAPLHIGGQVKAPLAIFKPNPVYPRLALQARVEGDVKIDAVIDKDGNVVQAHAVDGPPMLIAAALEAVKQWKYQPTYLNGVPWPVELTLNVTFQLS